MHVVRCGDCSALAARHPHAEAILNAASLSHFSTFPGAADDFPLLFYLLDPQDRLCAYFRVIPDQVTLESRTYRWAWTGDNYTLPEYRGRGLSTKLQGEGTRHLHELGIARGSVFSTEVTLHIFSKLGIDVAGYVPRFVAVRSAQPFLDAHASNRIFRMALSRPAQFAAWLMGRWTRARARGQRADVDCVPADTCTDSELQRLLDRTKGSYSAYFSTDLSLLRKKLAAARRMGRVDWWVLRDAASSDPFAYMVVRRRWQEKPLAEKYKGFNLMTLMDFGFEASDSRAAGAVLAYLVREFFSSDADVLEVISGNSELNHLARRCGLLAAGKGMSFSYALPGDWACSNSIPSCEHWPLTHFCGDAFAF